MIRTSETRYDTTPLRHAAADRGLTATVIAKVIGRSVSVVSRTLRGERHSQSPPTVAAIARFLGVPMERLRPAAVNDSVHVLDSQAGLSLADTPIPDVR